MGKIKSRKKSKSDAEVKLQSKPYIVDYFKGPFSEKKSTNWATFKKTIASQNSKMRLY